MRYTFTYDELSVLQKIFDEMDINVLSNEESDKIKNNITEIGFNTTNKHQIYNQSSYFNYITRILRIKILYNFISRSLFFIGIFIRRSVFHSVAISRYEVIFHSTQGEFY